jgi:hypothetical protein
VEEYEHARAALSTKSFWFSEHLADALRGAVGSRRQKVRTRRLNRR